MKRYCAPLLLALAAHGAAFAEPSLRRDVGPNTSEAYEKECGGCHFAYQPGWLPERSWRKLMGSLGQHFGENTELKAEVRDALLAYLVAGSADHRRSQRSLEVLAAITPGDTPTRISSVLYVGGIHGGFLDPAFRGKPEVKTLAQCPACHQQASRGWFSAVTYSVSDEDFRGSARKSTPAGPVSQRLPK
jgi:hypothetical protein